MRVTTKTEAASQVRKVLQTVKDLVAAGAKVNEATTRAHLLNPLLAALGYESIDDIEFEHYLPDGKTFLDYRLRVEGEARVSVEAKALDSVLTDKDAAQAVSYASILGDEWAVVTNAREWRLYHTFAQAPLSGKQILRADLVGWQTDTQFDDVFERLWLISKESFVNGAGPATWVASQKLDQLIKQALTDPSSAEVKYIRKRLDTSGVSVSNDQVAAWLKVRLDAPLATSTSGSELTSGIELPYPESAHKASKVSAREVADPSTDSARYWIIPAGKQGAVSAAEHLTAWLSKGFWGFGESTPGRKSIKPGDWACFYAAKSQEVLAYGQISGHLNDLVGLAEWPGPLPPTQPIYKVPLKDVVWLQTPVKLTPEIRASLDAFKGKEPAAGWSWLVQTTHRISRADYHRLTNQEPV
jgi:hypothetical protein